MSSMAAIEKVKIIVVGDSGAGKTSLVHLTCHNEPINNPSWTVGCGVEVKLYEYGEGTLKQWSYFVELWDVGGSSSHHNARQVFYSSVHGIILVYDLTNCKSHQNLQKWLAEVLIGDGGTKKEVFDPEHFVGITQDCSERRAFAAGTTNAVHLSRFFDKVIKLRYHTGATHSAYSSSVRRNNSPYVSPIYLYQVIPQ